MLVRRFSHVLAALALVTALLGARPALAQPIDLLRATRTDLAVSSAYRGRLTQAAALVDGDLETAWNSRTGDLAGAWIEVRLPADASVTSIALTAGFTRVSGQSDLFTGNHRVTRVRVLREGQEVGAYDLDPESRELQTLPVRGPGGTYRIEVVALLPGTRRQWREVCVSELRILGTTPGAREGQRFPRVAVGALSAPRPEPGASERAQVRSRLRDMTLRLGREWAALNEIQGQRRQACMLDDEENAETASLRARRQRFLSQTADLVELVDEVRADQLRASAFAPGPHRSSHYEFLDPNDQDLIAAGMHAVVDWLGEDEARCRLASADARLRLRRAADEVASLNHGCEHVMMDYPEGAPRDVRRQCSAVERALPTIEELSRLSDQLRSGAARIGRYTPSAELSHRFRDEWTALQAALGVARQSCGWAGR